MKGKINGKIHLGHRSLDSIFIIILLCIFAFGSLLLIVIGANIYNDLTVNMDRNFQHRTPLSYISTKVRQNDTVNSVSIIEKEGINTLVLKAQDGKELSETWIYEYDNYLYEIYTDEGASFQLADGLAILPSYGLSMEMEGNLLHLRAYDEDGQSRSLSIALRSTQGGESL